jgi:hypothetical protein
MYSCSTLAPAGKEIPLGSRNCRSGLFFDGEGLLSIRHLHRLSFSSHLVIVVCYQAGIHHSFNLH